MSTNRSQRPSGAPVESTSGPAVAPDSNLRAGFFPACARTALGGFRLAHAGIWALLGLAGKCVVVAYFVFCGLFLALRYGVLPNVDHYKPQIEQMASKAVGRPVTISRIDVAWSRFTPRLGLSEVVLHDDAGRAALRLPKVTAALSWWSVVLGELRLDALELDRPDVDIRRDAAGRLSVAGIAIDTKAGGDGRGADWMLSQHRIVIHDGRVRWTDATRAAAPLVLEKVDFRLENIWQEHAFALTATPPAALAAPLDVRGMFHHPRFSRKISDVSQWTGTLYADVRSPALAAWSAYLDYPITLSAGSGAVRSWLFFDREKIADFTADLHLADVSARLGPDLPPLELLTADGRISIQEEILPRTMFMGPVSAVPEMLRPQPASPAIAPATGAAPGGLGRFAGVGHTIAITGFSMQTRDGLRLPPTTISEKFTPARDGKPEQTSFSASLLDLRTLASVAERLPLAASQRRMLRDFSPRGVLQDFTGQWQGAYPDFVSYALKGRFSNLALQPQAARPSRPRSAGSPAHAAVPAIPGFDNLTGSVDANDRGGAFTLASTDLQLQLPGYFAEPLIGFDRFDMQASWAFQPQDQLLLKIASLRFNRKELHASLSGQHLMPLDAPRGKPLGMIDISGEFGGLEIAKIDTYLPLATPESLRTWLNGALLGGMLQNGTMRLKGDLANFPFHAAVAPGGAGAGGSTGSTGITGSNNGNGTQFRVAGRIDNGKLDVAPGRLTKDGKSPLWPLIEALQGSIVFDRGRMEIDASSARIHGVGLAGVKVVLPDLLTADKQLAVDGIASGALQDLVGFVNDSPVVDWIGRFTEETRATGNAVLALKMQLPLAHLTDSRVQGSLQLSGNDLSLQPVIPTLFQTSGKLEFTEKGVTLNGMKAVFIGGPVTASGGTQRDGAIVIKADGSVSSEGVRRTYPAAAIQRLADHVTGSSRYAATIAVRRKRLEIQVESSLQGIALDLPAPLRKSANEVLPFKFDLAGAPGDDSAGLRDEIRVSLGTALAARYQRQKSLEKNASWRVVRGGIGVNEPAPMPDSGVSANVSLRALNVDAWRNLIGSITGAARPSAGGGEGMTDAAAGAGVPGATAQAGTSEQSALAQYLEPEVLAARATELIVAGKKLDNVVVGVSHDKDVWQANIDAAQASGYVTWNQSRSGQGLGKVTARLTSLIIPKTAASDVTDILEGKNTTTQIPALDIVAENFELFGKKMGRVELAASNGRSSGAREWRINKLLLTNADAELKATGSWSRPASGESLTSLSYRLEIVNAGKLLERFGFPNVLKGGKGNMEGDVTWNGLPFSLDVPSLGGQLRIDLAAGQFLKVEPGAAKLLGVLSLQSLPRRLTLDFRDVFSEGFAFDGITGSVAIAQGAARTDNFKMRSVNATVLMDGSADIARETQNLHVAVIPEINVGTASVVYALAVNVVIGLGSFLAQLFLRDPLMRAFTFEYRISGPWTAPQVVKVDRKGNGAPAAPAPQAAGAG